MSDPIDELARFSSGFNATPGGEMPLSAAEVRRRGDRIRRRRTALVAGGVAAAVAAVTVPILALTGNSTDHDRDDIAEQSSLRVDDLLRDEDTEYSPNEASPWVTVDTYEGDGQAAFHKCQQEKLSALGATSSLTRFFDWSGTEPTPGTGLEETIAEFDTAGEARAAYDTIAGWIEGCESRIPDEEKEKYSVHGPRAADVPGADEAGIYDLHWGPVSKDLDPSGEDAYINETGLVLQGERIAVVQVTIIGQDYNFLDEDGGTPVFRMLPKAAERLEP